jgi:ASC-1-like (ASCH) protein
MNRQPEVHRLKTLQPYYREVKERKKNFELRLNDRDFQVGDTVVLEEWTGESLTGAGITRKIKYILKDCPQYGLKEGYCIFGW